MLSRLKILRGKTIYGQNRQISQSGLQFREFQFIGRFDTMLPRVNSSCPCVPKRTFSTFVVLAAWMRAKA